MSKAEQRALEKYPLMSNDDKEGLEALKYIGMECECASEYNEVQESKQAYFIAGYHQAEKDLELSWEDIQKIDVLIYAVLDEEKYKRYYTQDRDGDFYEEVLIRFKSYGKKEI